MARYCAQCGAPFPPGQKFCSNCGAPLETETLETQEKTQAFPREESPAVAPWSQQEDPGVNAEQMNAPSANHGNHANDQSVLIGLLVGIIILLLGGGAFFAYSSAHQEAVPGKTSPAPSVEKDQSAQTKSSSTSSAPVGSDLMNFVQEKDAVDGEIVKLANGINGYLSNHATFRGNSYYSDAARGLQTRLQNDMQQLKGTQAADEGKKQAILNLYQIEYRRVSGLYNGVMSSRQGGDYQPGFAAGTKASYEYDDANAEFRSRYSGK